MKPASSPIAPWIPLLAGMIAISFAPILVRSSDAPVSVQGMYRMLFTLVLMLPFGAKSIREARAVSRKDWLLLIAAGFFLALHFLLWMASLNYTSIASSTIILALEPVFVMIGAYFAFREKTNLLAVIGMGIALSGVIVVSSGDTGISRDALFGDFLSFAGMLAVVANMLIAKRLLTRISSYLYSLVVFGVASLFFALYNVAEGIAMVGYPAKEWGVFLLLAIVPTVFGHLIFNWLLQYVKATTISIAVLAEPVGASLLGMMLFSEMVTLFQYVGGALVIAGLIFYLRYERRSHE
ncbi:DMT family transporter [Cohnella faecalis]|uniref:DMT family transporter n=1 Tax=Cohnella faecalis TaxID=2315694 RepID=A0A398CME3_9BACL|nr:DMT family transporter [Cohnella faecalis]RIE00811.1 DMT family transporter [Cohnella faecalis]